MTTSVPAARARVAAPVLTGLLSGLVVQLLALTALSAAVLATDEVDPERLSFLLRVAAAGALGVALACGVAARVCRWRCRGRDVGARSARRAALLAGGLTGVVVLGPGLALALRWQTLPLYLAGVVLGSIGGALVSGAGRAARRRGRPTAG
jgi:hypothetical protein